MEMINLIADIGIGIRYKRILIRHIEFELRNIYTYLRLPFDPFAHRTLAVRK